jgi:hypothetical protein
LNSLDSHLFHLHICFFLRGHIISFKLSPNLRKKTKDTLKKDFRPPESETLKFDRIISTFRDKSLLKPELKALEIEDPLEVKQHAQQELERKADPKTKQKNVKFGENDDA